MDVRRKKNKKRNELHQILLLITWQQNVIVSYKLVIIHSNYISKKLLITNYNAISRTYDSS